MFTILFEVLRVVDVIKYGLNKQVSFCSPGFNMCVAIHKLSLLTSYSYIFKKKRMEERKIYGIRRELPFIKCLNHNLIL